MEVAAVVRNYWANLCLLPELWELQVASLSPTRSRFLQRSNHPEERYKLGLTLTRNCHNLTRIFTLSHQKSTVFESSSTVRVDQKDTNTSQDSNKAVNAVPTSHDSDRYNRRPPGAGDAVETVQVAANTQSGSECTQTPKRLRSYGR